MDSARDGPGGSISKTASRAFHTPSLGGNGGPAQPGERAEPARSAEQHRQAGAKDQKHLGQPVAGPHLAFHRAMMEKPSGRGFNAAV